MSFSNFRTHFAL